MPTNSAVMEEETAAPEITPEMLGTLKKEDMKQAVVERFKGKSASRKRSPNWQPTDREC